jgi:hypothetical protein
VFDQVLNFLAQDFFRAQRPGSLAQHGFASLDDFQP